MDFITIDFETATSERFSPCEIGLTFVKDNKIFDSKSWLIKPYSYPYFDSFNIMIHGIYPEDVANEPEFPEIWNTVKPLIENNLLIAHNAGFDFSVLRQTLEYYNIGFPVLQYACSYIISKQVWTGLPAYDLKTLCQVNNIKLKHHRAKADSIACAELSIKAFELTETQSIDEFPEKLRTTIGHFFVGGYKPSNTKRDSKERDLSLIVGNPEKHNPESIFYGRSVVFTGTLSSMIRSQAQQIIADIGDQDYRIVGEDGMSSKQENAVKLIGKGSNMEIISESDFLKNI
jgi:DNA polymerase-3 subunit epsilon